MAATKKSQSNRSENQLMETSKITRKSTRSAKKKSEVIGEKKDGNGEVPPSEESERSSASEVRCFCNDNREAGEMVQCEMCTGWFHVKCLRMKEGVGVLDGRAFVCCFCLSAKVLELTKLVGELRGEMIELRESVEVLSKENNDLVERVMVAEGEWKQVDCRGRLEETRKKPVSAISAARPGGRKNEQGERADGETLQGGKSKLGESPPLPVKKNKHGEYVGVRKLWGTRKKVSVEEVKECLGEKFDEAEKVEVVRVCKEDSGRTRWWFWLRGEEDVLGRLDRVVINDVWKVEKKSPLLGVASVRVLSR